MFNLMPLPYEYRALEPAISRETLEYHHGKHHRAYVEKLNELVEQQGLHKASLQDLVVGSTGEVFNNAGQVWNHEFYWLSLRGGNAGRPREQLERAINADFGSFEEFKQEFSEAAVSLFGSGWTWLTQAPGGQLEIEQTHDADNPLRRGAVPLLTCDVWEHAYYIDYRNARPDYVDAFWDVVDWERVNTRYSAIATRTAAGA